MPPCPDRIPGRRWAPAPDYPAGRNPAGGHARERRGGAGRCGPGRQGAGGCGCPERPSSYSGITLSDEGGEGRTHADPPFCIYCRAATEPSACGHIWSIWAPVVPGPDGPWCSLVWLACADGLASGSVGLASAPGVRHFAAAVGIKELPGAADACTATERAGRPARWRANPAGAAVRYDQNSAAAAGSED